MTTGEANLTVVEAPAGATEESLQKRGDHPISKFYVHNPDDAHRGFMDGCILWWRMKGNGYTTDLKDAGIFTEADRERGYPPSTCVWVPVEKARAVARTFILVWKRDLNNPFL